MRVDARPPTRKWPWIAAAILVIAGVIVALALSANGGNPTPSPTQTVSAPTTPSPSNSAEGDPTGCLGGPGRDAAMVVAAQEAAPHTSNGAVDFAASFVRWIHRYPNPSADDAEAVQSAAVADVSKSFDLAEYFQTQPNLSGGLVPDGVAFYASTVPGVWNLESSAEDEAVVSIGSGVVIDGALDPTLRGSITVTVHWEDNEWKFVSSEGTRTTQELYSIGLPFTDGC